MRTIGLLSDDKKLGSLAHQSERIGPVDELLQPSEDYLLWNTFGDDGTGLIRPGDNAVVIIAHARAFGRYKRGFALRDARLRLLASWGVAVQIGRDGDPVTYDEAEKIAEFHARALEPTGQATPKQKRNPGRPKTYIKPEGENLDMARKWYSGPLHLEDVSTLIGQMMRTDPVSRATLYAWFGKRPKCEGRARKPRSDKKN